MYLKNSSIKILSVGSGKCVIESIITDLFGIPIICIDPAPNSFNFVPRDSPFQKYVRNPDYKTVDEFILTNKDEKCNVIINYPSPNKNQYDYESLVNLYVNEFIIFYGTWTKLLSLENMLS